MLLGCIADDFTGAGDLAGAIVRLGLRACVVVDRGVTTPEHDVCVVALKSRSVPPAHAIKEALNALEWLQARSCRQYVFKYCSTFDSTPQGNIGPVGQALADRLQAKAVIVCPAYPANGRTVYQGHLFVGDRLLSESGMQNHPITPMTDPDLRRWLGYQTNARIGLIPLHVVRAGTDAVRTGIEAAAGRGETFVVADAVDDADIMTISGSVVHSPLVTGGAAIGAGLAASLMRSAGFEPRATMLRPMRGPGAVLAGSCSRATREQIKHYERSRPALVLDAASIIEGRVGVPTVCSFMTDNLGAEPICYTKSEPEEVAAVQRHYGATAAASALDGFFAEIAVALFERGFVRLVVAGGETSGAVIEALNPDILNVGREIAPGVPVMTMKWGDKDRAVALKSGNFGQIDFFSRALRLMEGDRVEW